MKAQNLVNNGTVTIEDLKNFIDGTGNFDLVKTELNKATGFESTGLDLNTDEDFSDSDILNADLIEQF